MSSAKLCEQIGKLINEAVGLGIVDPRSALQAKLILTPRDGTPERDAILGDNR
jgi:hypothetical protein